MNWDWEKLQEKRQRQHRTPQPQGEGPEGPFKDFQLGDQFSKFMGNGLPLWGIFAVLLLIWLGSGIFIVNPGEIAVITRFGKYTGQVADGPHYHLPYPIEKAEIVVAEPLRTVVIGQSFSGKGQKNSADEASMFTGDENIVHMRFNVQYNISDPQAFLFHVRDPETTIKIAAEAAMREVVGRSNIDSILTTGRTEVQVEALAVLENILDSYGMGVRIHTVQLLDVQPPPEVEAAFKNVASAREKRAAIVNRAEAYRMEIVPEANGTAIGMINDSRAYRQKVEQRALGEAVRFQTMVEEFRKAPDVTKKRMYLDAMNDMLSTKGIDKIIMPKDTSNVLPLLNLTPSPANPQLPAAPQGGKQQ